MAERECVYDETLTFQFPGEHVFLKRGAIQSIFYIFQQLKGIRGINQFENYSSQPQAITVNVKASLCEVKCFILATGSVTHPRFDQQAASYTEHSGQPKGSAH